MTPAVAPVRRYHPLLVALHWLLAVLIVAALASGYLVLAATPNTDPRKIDSLRLHMAGGMLILALTVLRWIVRLCTARPGAAATGQPLLDRSAAITHRAFYVIVVGMAATGFATGLLAGLPEIVFARSGAPLPPDLAVYPTRVIHGALAAVLLALIVWHGLAAWHHQVVRRDGLLGRMAFGRRR